MTVRPSRIQNGQPAVPDPIDPRAPAHAVRQLVQQDGRQAPRALYEAFDAYNAEHFGGSLKQSLILLTAPASPRAEGDYVAQDAHGIPSRIRIAPRIERYGNLYLLDVLLHEMVHAWQHEVLDDLENGYRGHGPKFCQKANELHSQLPGVPVPRLRAAFANVPGPELDRALLDAEERRLLRLLPVETTAPFIDPGAGIATARGLLYFIASAR